MHNSYCTPTQTCRFLINPIVFAWSSGTFSKFVVLRFVNISPEILSIASTDVFSVSGTFAKTSILCSDDEVHNCGNFCADAESFPLFSNPGFEFIYIFWNYLHAFPKSVQELCKF